MNRRPVTTRIVKHPDDWSFGPQARRTLDEGQFPALGQRDGETLGDYLERRYRDLTRTGMSRASVAIALRLAGRDAGDEAMAAAVIAGHERPKERE